MIGKVQSVSSTPVVSPFDVAPPSSPRPLPLPPSVDTLEVQVNASPGVFSGLYNYFRRLFGYEVTPPAQEPPIRDTRDRERRQIEQVSKLLEHQQNIFSDEMSEAELMAAVMRLLREHIRLGQTDFSMREVRAILEAVNKLKEKFDQKFESQRSTQGWAQTLHQIGGVSTAALALTIVVGAVATIATGGLNLAVIQTTLAVLGGTTEAAKAVFDYKARVGRRELEELQGARNSGTKRAEKFFSLGQQEAQRVSVTYQMALRIQNDLNNSIKGAYRDT